MKKFFVSLLIYLLVSLYVGVTFCLAFASNLNAIPFLAYMIVCLISENARFNKFLAEKAAKTPLYRILDLNILAMAMSVALSKFIGLELIPTLILTTLGIFVLGVSINKELEEAGKHCYRTDKMIAFRGTMILFPVPVAVLTIGLGTTVHLYYALNGATIFWLVPISQVLLGLGVGLLLTMYLNEEFESGWATTHEVFHEPAPEEEKR
ncbi:MAG: hypothetical protein HZA94_01910 [Candidatus Vogelbacteria bacterium]|nr:hypothetical protein [Candidatus Vogelbacteria bacterium]